MENLWLVLACLSTFALSTWLTHRFLDPQSVFHVLDHPNERSLHRSPVPRTGGVAILAALLLGGLASAMALSWPREVGWIALGALALGLVSLADDRFGLAVRYRLLAHLLAGVLLFAVGLGVDRLELPGWDWVPPRGLAWALSLLFVAWMINLYNFMDGMDGLAAGMALIGFGALGVLGWQGGDPPFAWGCLLIACAAGGFLRWNAPPARIFMGDVGSSVLGFLAAAAALWGSERGLFPLWVAVLIFSPFVVDATWTLLRRLHRGERLWEAHRSHHYQRLVQAGWGQRKTLLGALALMLAAAFTAVRAVGLPEPEQWFLIGAWAGLYALVGWKVRQVECSAEAR